MEKYNIKMRINHWVMAVLIFTLLAVGWWMQGLPADYPGKFDTIYPLHKSFGLLSLIYIFYRFIERSRSYIPPYPKEINRFDRAISSITIFLLYFCMMAMPMSGYLMSTLGGHDVAFFGFILPGFLNEDKDLGKLAWQAHTFFGYSLAVLIGLHLLGTLKHYIFEKINLLPRILWGKGSE